MKRVSMESTWRIPHFQVTGCYLKHPVSGNIRYIIDENTPQTHKTYQRRAMSLKKIFLTHKPVANVTLSLHGDIHSSHKCVNAYFSFSWKAELVVRYQFSIMWSPPHKETPTSTQFSEMKCQRVLESLVCFEIKILKVLFLFYLLSL